MATLPLMEKWNKMFYDEVQKGESEKVDKKQH